MLSTPTLSLYAGNRIPEMSGRWIIGYSFFHPNPIQAFFPAKKTHSLSSGGTVWEGDVEQCKFPKPLNDWVGFKISSLNRGQLIINF